MCIIKFNTNCNYIYNETFYITFNDNIYENKLMVID